MISTTTPEPSVFGTVPPDPALALRRLEAVIGIHAEPLARCLEELTSIVRPNYELEEELVALQDRIETLTAATREGASYCKAVDQAISALSNEPSQLDLSMTVKMKIEDEIMAIVNALDDVREAIAFV